MTVARTPLTASGARRPGDTQLVLSIEGNIGIGKSTLLTNLRRRFAADPRVAFVDEPVDTWEKTGLLKAMYTGEIDRCSFQQMAVITRFGALQDALKTGADLIITERSIFTDRECFAKVGISDAAEIAAYAVTHDMLVQNLPPHRMATVLLDAPLSVITARIRMRGRSSEDKLGSDAPEGAPAADQPADESAGGVPEAYLQLLQQAHESYFASLPAETRRVVQACNSPEQVEADVYAAITHLQAATATREIRPPPTPPASMASLDSISPVPAHPGMAADCAGANGVADPLEHLANSVLDMDAAAY